MPEKVCRSGAARGRVDTLAGVGSDAPLFVLLMSCLLVVFGVSTLTEPLIGLPGSVVVGVVVGALVWLIAYGPVKRRFGRCG